MNDPAKTVIDIEEQRAWLNDLHKQLGSWSEVAKRTGIPAGTISQFGAGKYSGDNTKVAEKIIRYRQTLAAHRSIVVDMPERPDFFETPTSSQLTHMLTFAQRFGRIVVAAMGPGLGKSATARHYKACFSNVFVATMKPSTAGVNNMQIAILKAMGDPDARGTPQKLSDQIIDRAKNLRGALIVIDEAQHLSEKALDEIRGWNDEAGVGIALFGNAGVLQRLEGGNRRINFAQLFSRIGLRLQQAHPLEGDVDALAEAWSIYDDKLIAALKGICLRPGGLRNGTHVLEVASMIAASQGEPLTEGHIGDAWLQLSSRAAAA